LRQRRAHARGIDVDQQTTRFGLVGYPRGRSVVKDATVRGISIGLSTSASKPETSSRHLLPFNGPSRMVLPLESTPLAHSERRVHPVERPDDRAIRARDVVDRMTVTRGDEVVA
jgi:hypothetical protein